jgi:hypothetical protein
VLPEMFARSHKHTNTHTSTATFQTQWDGRKTDDAVLCLWALASRILVSVACLSLLLSLCLSISSSLPPPLPPYCAEEELKTTKLL